MRVDELDHVALRVTDMDRSVAWYTDVLGLEREDVPEWGEYPVVLKAGHASIALFSSAAGDAAPAPADSIRALHVAFRLSGEAFAEARRELEERGLSPQFQDHAICHSLYVQDPDGHQIEITTYDVPRA